MELGRLPRLLLMGGSTFHLRADAKRCVAIGNICGSPSSSMASSVMAAPGSTPMPAGRDLVPTDVREVASGIHLKDKQTCNAYAQ